MWVERQWPPLVWLCLPCQVFAHEECQGGRVQCECWLAFSLPGGPVVLCSSLTKEDQCA